MSDGNINFSRILLAETLKDVRQMRPGIKVRKATFYVWGRTKDHQGRRWMEFEFEGVTKEGYFHNAYEGRTKGWDAWIEKQGEL